jgi:hypothetical protein
MRSYSGIDYNKKDMLVLYTSFLLELALWLVGWLVDWLLSCLFSFIGLFHWLVGGE